MAKKSKFLAANSLPKIAIQVDTSTYWGRQLIQGVANYARKHGPWHLRVEPRGRSDSMQLPHNWDGDGIIARVATRKLAESLSSLNVPIVNISGIELDGYEFPRVAMDYDATAKLAVEHFHARGFQNFAYVGPLSLSYVKRHADAFQRQIGCDESQLARFNYAHESMASERWIKQDRGLIAWLKELPKPLAVFAWGTSAPCQLLEACHSQNIIVPDEVAVLAGDNDDVISETTLPPMSGVLNPSLQLGYHSAKILDDLMRGASGEGIDVRFAPIEIVTRRSTEALVINDDELRAAVRYMHQNAFSELTVEQVADAVPMTRRSLERKFKQWLNRSPLEEIRRLRIARVKELLATTDLPMSRVALASGFGTQSYMTTVFKNETELTPLRFRSQARAR